MRGEGEKGRRPVHRAILELGESILAEPNLMSLLRQTARVVAGVIHTDVVAVLEVRSDQKSMRGLAAAGTNSIASMRRIVGQSDPSSLEALLSGKVVVVRDLTNDRRFGAPATGVRSMLSGITSTIHGGPTPFGVLTARSWKPQRFTDVQVHVVEDAAALLGRTLIRREAERAVRASEERFRLLAERSPDALFRTRIAPQPRLEYISPAVEQIVGYTASELLDIERQLAWQVIHPDDRPKAVAFLSDPANNPYPLSLRWIHKNGSVVYTDHRVTPILNAQGEMIGIEGVIRDVTERILVEQRRQSQAEVTQLIVEGRPADEVVRAAVVHLRRLSGADDALLVLRGTDRPGWVVRIIGSDDVETPTAVPLSNADPLMQRVTQNTAPTVIDHFSKALPAEHPLAAAGWSGPAILATIRSSNGPLGVLGIANRAAGHRFSRVGSRAVGDFARQAALAIEYGRARDNLRQLAVLEDRNRIARELHDGVIQSLFGAGMLLEGIGENKEVRQSTRDGIARVTQMIDGAMVDVRNSIYDLRPSALMGRNIEQALRSLIEDFEKASSIPCKVSFEPEAVRALESSAQDLVQIVREALSNVARHSQASACTLAVYRKGDEILLEVSDNGKGFKPAKATAGIGLTNLRGRATEIGDHVEVISEPGKGSTVRVIIPS